MIRINLLPVRAAQKKEQLHAQIVVLVISVVAALAVCVAMDMMVRDKVEMARQDLQSKQSELNRLKSVIGEVKGFEAKKKELTAKLDILDKLKANRIGPVRVLDELSRATPEKVWIESFSQNDVGAVEIRGVGLKQEDVADFMRNLEASRFYKNVELIVIDEKVTKDRTLENFSIKCALEPLNQPSSDNLGGKK